MSWRFIARSHCSVSKRASPTKCDTPDGPPGRGQTCTADEEGPFFAEVPYILLYSRSPKNPALQLLQNSSKSPSAGSSRPIWNSFATVGVRDFWENGCISFLEGLRLGLRPSGQQNGAPLIADHVPTASATQVGEPVGSYGACPKYETWLFFLFFSAHWPSATVR